MYSPRISGKSHALAQIVYLFANQYPGHDIVVTRANYNSLEDSIYNEILDTAEQLGIGGFYKGLTSPLRIKTKKGNTIYFKGIGGAGPRDRPRGGPTGLRPRHRRYGLRPHRRRRRL